MRLIITERSIVRFSQNMPSENYHKNLSSAMDFEVRPLAMQPTHSTSISCAITRVGGTGLFFGIPIQKGMPI